MKKAIKLSLLLLISLSFMSMNEIVIYTSDQVELSVVVNAPSAPSELNLKELKTVLKGEKQRWKDGTKISLAFMKTSTNVGSDMSRRIFGMTEKELNKFFLAKVFQGKMTSPEFFDSETELLNYVKNTKGAISVIDASNSTNLKKINIDGRNKF